MRTIPFVVLLTVVLALLLGCPPRLGGGGGGGGVDDDDAAADDDTSDDDDSIDDDDDDAVDDDTTDDDDDTPIPPADGLGYGWYFGECWGACLGDLWLGLDNLVTLSISNWDGEWYLERSSTLTGDGEDQFSAAMESVPWFDLEEVYGCPDCDDGGGEYIWLAFEGEFNIRADYEHGNPPDEVWMLDLAFDEMVQELLTCEFDFWLVAPAECEPWEG